jgi:hypothetical protein
MEAFFGFINCGSFDIFGISQFDFENVLQKEDEKKGRKQKGYKL